MSRGIADTRFTLGEIIASGWDLYCLHFLRILPIFLVVYVPINIGLSFIPADQWIEKYGLYGFRMYMTIIQLTEFFIGVLATMALARLIEESLYGHTISWLQALRHAVWRWEAAVITGFLAGLIVLGLTFLLIVPGLIWAIYYSFFLSVVALRGLSGKQALDYSKALVQGQWWRVLGFLLAIQSLGFLSQVVVMLPFSYSEHQVVDVLSNTLSNIVSALFLTMMIVFFLNNDYVKANDESGGLAVEDSTDTSPGLEG